MDTLQPALRAPPALFSRAASFPRNTLEPSVEAKHAEAAELLYLVVAQIPQIPIGRTPLSAFPFRPNIAAIFQFRPDRTAWVSVDTVSRGIMLSCGHSLHPSRLSLWPGPADVPSRTLHPRIASPPSLKGTYRVEAIRVSF